MNSTTDLLEAAPDCHGAAMDDSVSAKILTVDDDPQIRSLLRRLLEPEGYKVTEAANGREARSLLSQHDFDLVLLDLNLPEVDGLSLAQELRARSDVAIWPAPDRDTRN